MTTLDVKRFVREWNSIKVTPDDIRRIMPRPRYTSIEELIHKLKGGYP